MPEIVNAKFSLSQIQDLKEDRKLDDEEVLKLKKEDCAAEEYHLEMIKNQSGRPTILTEQAERALKSAPSITRAEFFKKWG